ncbi:MAG: YggS family pyridoxal phosphate-dependent enzyme [Oscillospiraceae bacterium]|nr:YggS family pyridoxal phosphate-dependent enzyme [Oscillospiraceae bacterium]
MTEKLSLEKRFLSIEENYKEIKENIAAAAERSGRNESDIRFMAVTKTVEPIFINHALSLGIDLIGENKVQELLSKTEFLEGEAEKHIIGHLQSNKARKIINEVSMIESVDSVSLAAEISRQAVNNSKTMDILLEVNIGAEASKTGFDFSAVNESAFKIAEMKNICIRGLMAVPPICEEKAELRAYFSKMRRLFEDMKSSSPAFSQFDTLSLGMSGDYAEAIEEGSTLIRVGSALFGMRRY